MSLSVNNNIGYSIFGNPIIENGVVSGFSNNDYLKMFQIDLSNPFEILFKVKTPSTWGTAYDIIFSTASTYRYTFQKNGPNKQFAYYVPNESGTGRTQHNGNLGLLEDTIYYIRTRFTGTQLIIDRSTDKKNWLIEYQENRTVGFFNNTEYAIGRNATAAQQAWSGCIYITDCYIKVNNYTIFNGKQQANTVLGYIKVGNPTINDNIVSGFSNGNYIKTNVAPYLRQSKNFEIKTKFKVSSTSGIIFIANNFTIGLMINSDGKFGLYLSEGEEYNWNIAYNTKGTHVVSVNTDYYIKVIYDGTSYILKVSTDDVTYIDDITIQSSKTLGGNSNSYALNFGVNYNGTSSFLDGSIDLNNTYIKANSRTWFDGKDYISSPINDVYINRNVGYNIVGNPTINNGVVSGFSVNDYLSLNVDPTYTATDTFEWNIKFTTGSSMQTSWLLSLSTSTIMRGIYYGANGVLFVPVGSGSQYGQISGLTTETTYIVNVLKKSDGNLITTLKSANGTIISTQTKAVGNVELVSVASKLGQAFSSYFNGSINLNETYIKVNGVTWFNGKQQASPAVNEVYLNRNVGYTVVGSPTINNGVVSGFSSSDYLELSSNVTYGKNFEFFVSFITASSLNGNQTIFDFSSNNKEGFCLLINRITETLFISAGNGSSSWIIDKGGITKLSSNTKYFAKFYYNGNVYKLDLSTDNINWTNEISVTSANEISTTIYKNIGYSHRFSGRQFQGAIDLNNTYIKVNGVTWFDGKDVNFSNQNNYIINNGNLVWANPNLWLQGNGAQYIDTGIYGFNTTDYELCWKQTGSSNYYGVFGSRKSISEDRLTIVIGAPSESDKYLYVSNYNSTYYQTTYSNLTPYQKRILIKNNGTLTLDGVNKTIATDKEYQTPTTLKLFVTDTNGTLSNFLNGNIYYSKLYNDNTLVSHLVPVPKGLVIGNYTVPSNGMWDIVTQTFFGNQGTGSFTFGKDGTSPIWKR